MINDIHFSPEFIKFYKLKTIEINGTLFPFALIEYNGLKSMLSIGYQGIITKSNNIEKMRIHINDFCKWHNIITIFIRYNPILNNHIYSPFQYEKANDVLIIENFHNIKEYIKTRPSRLKSILNKINDLNLYYNKDIDNSIILNALKYKNEYFSKKQHIKQLINNNLCTLFQAFYKNTEIASSLFLLNNSTAYYIANYSTKTGKEKYANIFLLFEFIKYAKQKNIKFIILGGGIKNKDSLFKFKEQFANKVLNIYHSKIIINNSIYKKFNKNNNYFPSWLENVNILDYTI